ncbi:hypothetical protein [Spiroplasma endosymbiont of Aspidapion aeneum]|uniref:hypothetical protein n=1 Tax=Spiroplasma endosymbiont of Aspidapion aeneum TaxID=3066276 RepID=UPI00313BF9A5
MNIDAFLKLLRERLIGNILHHSIIICINEDNDFQIIYNSIKELFTEKNKYYTDPEFILLSDQPSKSEINSLLFDFSLKKDTNKFKYYVIKNIDNMNVYASNSILKFLEEPPKNTYGFMFAKNFSNILETIKSRCLNFKIAHIKKIGLPILENINKCNIFVLSEKLNKLTLNECYNEFVDYYLSNIQIFNYDNSNKYLDLLNKLYINNMKSMVIESFISLLLKVHYANS